MYKPFTASSFRILLHLLPVRFLEEKSPSLLLVPVCNKLRLSDKTGEKASGGRRIVFDAVKFVPAGPSPAPPKEAGKPRSAPKIEQSVKVGTRRLDQLVDMVGELVIAQQMDEYDDVIVVLLTLQMDKA